MKNGHQNYRHALASTATQSSTAVGQPGNLTDLDRVDCADAQEGSPVGNGPRMQDRFRTVIAIDPGASGGVAFQLDGQIAEAVAMPATEGDLVDLLRRLAAPPGQALAIIEEVSGFVGKPQPGCRMFTFGRNFGFILGVLQTLGVRVELVKPAKWQKALSLGTAKACASKTIWKNKLKACAQRLYPHLRVSLQIADALLVLEYGSKTRGRLVTVNTSPAVGGLPD